MTTSVLAELLASLDVVVFERLPDGVLLRLGPARPPAWFARLFLEAARNEPVTVAEAFPFLGHFLTDAEDFWREPRETRLRSAPFMMTDPTGGEIALVASALAIGHRRFLTLELPYEFEEHRRALQSAREHVLAHDEHVRRTGALLKPVDAARRLVEQLATTGLTPEQQQLAAGIQEQLASLAASLDALVPAAKHLSRSSRR